MTRLFSTRITALAGAAFLVASLAGCPGDKPPAAEDSALLQDLAQAERANPGPALEDTALGARASAKPRPTTKGTSTTPRSTPSTTTTSTSTHPDPTPVTAPARRAALGAGTTIDLATGSKVCTSTIHPGDKFIATLTSDVVGPDGFRFAAGSKAVIEVAAIYRAPNADSARIDFRVRSIYVDTIPYHVTGDVATLGQMQRTARASQGGDKTKVIGGAIAGAVLGQMIGHDAKGTIIGAAAGAAAGTAAAQASRKYEGCLPAASALRLTLAEPLYVS